jgi:hypothetical protein
MDCGVMTTSSLRVGYVIRSLEHTRFAPPCAQLTKLKCLLAINNSLISLEFATGYVTDTWDDRMHILITITSCGTLINQALTKTAFAVTLLKLTKNWTHSGYQWVLWFCIGSMNLYMIAKIIVQWGKICGKKSYDVYYRLDFCVDANFRDDFKEGGNGELPFAIIMWLWLIS